MKKVCAFGYVLKNSLTNLSYYGEVKNTSFWFLLKYLYLLFIITSFITLLPIVIDLASWKFPRDLSLTLQNGELSTTSNQPYFYKDLFVIDTNARIENYPSYKQRASVLITKDAIIYPKDSDSQPAIFSLNQVKENFSLDYNSYQESVKKISPYLALLIILWPIISACFSLSWTLFSLLFLAVIIFLIVKLLRGAFSFKQIYKMTILASTLPTLFFTALGLFNLTPAIPFGYFLILGLFLTAVLHRLWTKTS